MSHFKIIIFFTFLISCFAFIITEFSLIQKTMEYSNTDWVFYNPEYPNQTPDQTASYYIWGDNDTADAVEVEHLQKDSRHLTHLKREAVDQWNGFSLYVLHSLKKQKRLIVHLNSNLPDQQIAFNFLEKKTEDNPYPEVWQYVIDIPNTGWNQYTIPLDKLKLNEFYFPAGQPGNLQFDSEFVETLGFDISPQTAMDLELGKIIFQQETVKWIFIYLLILLQIWFLFLLYFFNPFKQNTLNALPNWTNFFIYQLLIAIAIQFPDTLDGIQLEVLGWTFTLLIFWSLLEAWIGLVGFQKQTTIKWFYRISPLVVLTITLAIHGYWIHCIYFLSIHSINLIYFEKNKGLLISLLYLLFTPIFFISVEPLTVILEHYAISLFIILLYFMFNRLAYSKFINPVQLTIQHLEYEKNEALSSLRASERKMAIILNHITDGIIIVDDEDKIELINPASVNIFGFPEKKLIHHDISMLIPEYLLLKNELTHQQFNYFHKEIKALNSNKIPIDIEVTITQILKPDLGYWIVHVRDITTKKRLENQILHTQKMESITHLTGGVAHNFNNLLTSIIGNMQISLESAISPTSEYINKALLASQRAADLVKSLQEFSRNITRPLDNADVEDLIYESINLIECSMMKTIQLEIDIQPNLPPIYVDSSHFLSVLINLCINSRDAINEKKEILSEKEIEQTTFIIEIKAEVLHPEKSQHLSIPFLDKKDYVCISVSDNGIGIPNELQSQVFDPFFTTKKEGEGTGLGLYCTYSTIKQCGGVITLDSEYLVGTTFYIYLPISDQVNDTQQSLNSNSSNYFE